MMRPIIGVALVCLLLACSASAPAAPPAAAPSSPVSAAGPGAAAPAASADNPYLAAPGEAPISARMSTCAVAAGFVHVYAALHSNLFEKYGLRVEHTVIRGTNAALSALIADEVQFLYCAGEATMPGLTSGIPAKLVTTLLQGLPYVMISRADVRTVPDLRGKSIGVTRPGDLSDRLSRLTVEKFGLRPNEDVEIRPIGGSLPERYQALVADVIQAVALTPPLDVQARKEGMNVIYDLADLGIPYVHASFHVSNTMIRDNPRVVQRFVAAMAEALRFVEQNPEAARQAIQAELAMDDPDVLEATYNTYGRKLVNRRMNVSFEGVAAAIEESREQGTQVTVRGPEDIATNQFVDDLERTGQLQRLWGADLPAR